MAATAPFSRLRELYPNPPYAGYQLMDLMFKYNKDNPTIKIEDMISGRRWPYDLDGNGTQDGLGPSQ